MDTVSRRDRSRNMSRIRSSNTGPELEVRRILRHLNLRYRGHRRSLPGTPDFSLLGRRAAIFVNGCFWHRHSGCRRAYSPKSRVEFWTAKFQSNVTRDRQARLQLRRLGWRVAVVWECQLRSPSRVRCALARLGSPEEYERRNHRS